MPLDQQHNKVSLQLSPSLLQGVIKHIMTDLMAVSLPEHTNSDQVCAVTDAQSVGAVTGLRMDAIQRLNAVHDDCFWSEWFRVLSSRSMLFQCGIHLQRGFGKVFRWSSSC